MQKINVHFENCYGIRLLDAEFDFTHKRANLIYAPNGAMKTSFAQTFKDHSNNVDSKDRVYPERETIREITTQDKEPLPAEFVFVIEPYDPLYESERVSTLLANNALKSEYDHILKEIDEKCSTLITLLKKISGIRSGLEDIISKAFTRIPDNLLRAFERVKIEVYEEQQDPALTDVKYNTLFSDKILAFLEDPEVKGALSEYTENYDALLSRSRFFRKGVFNHYQAGEIAKQLKNHGFFKADHKVFLSSEEGGTKVESEEELEKLINEELEAILSDEQLKTSFEKIDKKLSNRELRDFREFLLANKTLIPRLRMPDVLKEDLLKSYLIGHKLEFENLMTKYEEGKKRLEEITKEASEQATEWQQVINIFNRRFAVPFKVGIENKQDVILKRVTPNISFTFEDETLDPKSVEREALVDILSSGERKALYILNIIFEIEARISEGIPTVFVIDDVADSFDYKNKYAIIEYLGDILSQGDFRQIILTHNYDFYRSVWHRLNLGGANYHISRSDEGISLTEEKMYRDPFQKWRKLPDGEKKTDAIIAMIPFVRNLANYCGYQEEFNKLTSLLHIKLDCNDLKIDDLLVIYSKILNGQEFSLEFDGDQSVVPLILETANRIVDDTESTLDLEKKIVLSIAIRLNAERIMIDGINDDDWVKTIGKNQTNKLAARFKKECDNKDGNFLLVELMDRVMLMTPENIHLNSFMYEPILDMSSEHLCNLHRELCKISENIGGMKCPTS